MKPVAGRTAGARAFAEQHNEWLVEGVGGREDGVHQRVPDAAAPGGSGALRAVRVRAWPSPHSSNVSLPCSPIPASPASAARRQALDPCLH